MSASTPAHHHPRGGRFVIGSHSFLLRKLLCHDSVTYDVCGVKVHVACWSIESRSRLQIWLLMQQLAYAIRLEGPMSEFRSNEPFVL